MTGRARRQAMVPGQSHRKAHGTAQRTARTAAAIGVLACLLAGSGGAPLAATAHVPPRPADLENFRLAGPDGRSYSIESFPPSSVLAIYFGYTTCLRACPTTLNTIADVIERLGPAGVSVRPVFIDIDPDSAAQVSVPLYMQAFGPSFLGLVGPPDAIALAARSFRVTVEKLQFSADPEDYAMKHVSPIFIMRPTDPHPIALPADSSAAAVEAAIRGAIARAN